MKFIFLLVALSTCCLSFSQTKEERLKYLLGNPKFSWKIYPSENFKFIVEKDQFADQRINSLKEDFSRIRNEIIQFLGGSDLTDTATIVIADSNEKMKSILGYDVYGFSSPEVDMIYFVANAEHLIPAEHELTHYYSFKIWGRAFDNWLSEGLAVYYARKWSSYQIDSLAKHLKDSNKLFKMASLRKNFYALNHLIAYPQLGSFTSFLFSTYGHLKFRELWFKGVENIRGVYGKSLKDLEYEWLKYLDKFHDEKIEYSRYIN
jgi:hypothetical protein